MSLSHPDQGASGSPPWPTPDETPTVPAPPTSATPPAAGVDPEARKPRRTLRWAVAAAATAVVLVAAASLAFFAGSGRQTTPFGPDFLPADTLGYVEVRPDLPGDQRARFIEFLSAFPGWDDRAAFDAKIIQAIDDRLSEATGGRIVATRDIQPWFDGRIAVGISGVPTDPTDVDAVFGGYVLGVGVKDRAALEAAVDRLRAELTATFSEESYAGATIVTATGRPGPLESISWAITDRVLLVAVDPTRIRSALDVMAGTSASLASRPEFMRLFDQVTADRVFAAYSDLARIRPLIQAQLDALRERIDDLAPFRLGGILAGYFDAVVAAYGSFPDQVVQVLTFEGDHVTYDSVGTPGPRTPTLSVRRSGLAARMPAETMVYLEVRDVGTTIHNAAEWVLTLARDTVPDEQLDQVEAFLGTPVGDYLDFVQDVAVSGWYDGQKVQLGLAATVTDEATATARVDRLLSTVRLGAAAGGVPVSVTETDVAGVTVTTIALTDTSVVPPGAPLETSVSVAVGNGVLLVGTGDLAAQALQRDEAASLAGDARFQAAISAAGDPNAGVLYVDLAGIRSAAEAVVRPPAGHTVDVRPWLDPLDRLVVVAGQGDGLISLRAQLFVQQ